MSRKAKLEAAIYNIPEVAALLDINITTAYDLAKRPGFPAVRIGDRRIVVPKRAFHHWLNQQAGISE